MTNCANKQRNKFQKMLEQNVKISLHRLPKDINRRKLWLNNIGLDENINLSKHASICSLHFKEEDINRTLDKICLHENAVPYAYAFVDSRHSEQENIENQQNYLNVSFSSVDRNSDSQVSCLETSFSSIDTYCTKKLNTGNQNDNNHQGEGIAITDKQMFLNECTGELKKEPLLTDKLEADYVVCDAQCSTAVLDEKIFIDRSTSPIKLSENSNLKIHRSTSVSPQHFQDDISKDETIKYLKASLEEYKRKSQQTIRRLKRKVKQKKSKADFAVVMSSLKSKLNKDALDVLEKIGKSNKEFLLHIFL